MKQAYLVLTEDNKLITQTLADAKQGLLGKIIFCAYPHILNKIIQENENT